MLYITSFPVFIHTLTAAIHKIVFVFVSFCKMYIFKLKRSSLYWDQIFFIDNQITQPLKN